MINHGKLGAHASESGGGAARSVRRLATGLHSARSQALMLRSTYGFGLSKETESLRYSKNSSQRTLEAVFVSLDALSMRE